jgi:hypothetical protein
MEPVVPLGVPLGVPPPYDDGAGAGAGAGLRLRKRRSSSFPIKDDAGYIGYLTDDESASGSDDQKDMRWVSRCRRELLAIDGDMSFSFCILIFITSGCLLLLFLFAASPWGVPPPVVMRGRGRG